MVTFVRFVRWQNHGFNEHFNGLSDHPELVFSISIR